MAANNIELTLTGKFVDNISAKAKAAFGSVAKLSRGVGGAINGASAAISTFGGKAESALGKAASGLGNILGSLATLGPMGALITGASVAFEYFSKRATAASEAALKFANSLKQSIGEKLAKARAAEIERMNESLSKTVSEADKAAKAITALAASYEKLASAQSATISAENSLEVAKLLGEKQSALGAAGSDEDKARTGAAYDVQIAKVRLAQAIQEQSDKVETATAAQRTADRKLQAAADKEAALRDELAKAEEELIEQSGLDAALDKALRARRDKALAEYEKAVQEHSAAETDAEAATEKVKAAKLAQEAAIVSATTAVKAAEQTERDLDASLKDAKEKRIKAEEEAALAAQRKDLEAQLGKAEANAADALAGQADAANALAAAQQKFDDNINANLANARTNRIMAAAGTKGAMVANFAGADEQAIAAQVAVNRGIADGSIRNMAQLQQAERAAARANRDYNSSKAANQEKRDAREYERISNKSEKARSQWEKDRLAKLQKLKDAKDADANDLANAKDKIKNADDAVMETQKDVAAIKKKLEELGLK